ncbi:unnamed protein product [Fraxinus pennsylvanica]|uniref:PXMP2/4 family protein 2 n=1 Tax=Fraxinus pennsylvanica TaxID=56036 RepID=A0AAD2DMQ0_9LAMI|nr:unnamed protein product [Fraxinus pennsylvanica]
MLKLWKWYQKCLAVHPVKTQVISSGFIWGFGDIAAQAVTNSTVKRYHNQTPDDDKEFKINWRRVATTSLFGFGFVGPVGHFWYEGLDRFIRLRLQLRPNSFRFVTTKVVVDGMLFGPLDLLVFFTYMGFSTGKSAAQVKDGVKRDFLPALVLEGGVWPIVQVVNFRYVPVRNKKDKGDDLFSRSFPFQIQLRVIFMPLQVPAPASRFQPSLQQTTGARAAASKSSPCSRVASLQLSRRLSPLAPRGLASRL